MRDEIAEALAEAEVWKSLAEVSDSEARQAQAEIEVLRRHEVIQRESGEQALKEIAKWKSHTHFLLLVVVALIVLLLDLALTSAS